jgi:hypothetical protein
MWQAIPNLTASEWAAWYAAFVASLALLWEIITYLREGIKLDINAQPDVLLVGEGQPNRNKKYVRVNVKHVGGPPTTVTHVGMRKFDSLWHKISSYRTPSWFRRIVRVPQHDLGVFVASNKCQFPQRIEVGSEWNCLLDQAEFPEVTNGERLYLVIAHTLGDREIHVRLNL